MREVALLKTPSTNREIASLVGVSVSAVAQARSFHGIPSTSGNKGGGRQRWWAEDVVQMMELRGSGWSNKEIAQAKNTSPSVVKDVLVLAKKRGMVAYPKRPVGESHD